PPERNLVPGQARRAHVDRPDRGRIVRPAGEHPGLGLERKRALAALLGQEVGNAAHAVAAGARLRAVIVIDAHVGVGAARARGMQRHQLVVRRSRGPRDGARFGRGDGTRLRAHVHHHDLVAETVHLDESVVGERAHWGPCYARLIWAKPRLWPARVVRSPDGATSAFTRVFNALLRNPGF